MSDFTDFTNERGRDMQEHTGEHQHHGILDFDVWCYRRVGSGWTVVGRQMPPQPMLEDLGVAVVPPNFWTINVARGLTTFLAVAEADDDSQRIPFDDLPPDVQGEVYAHASSGWEWGGVAHRYDPVVDDWVEV